ncbi:hypothetical protein PG989_001828 [Apiospora arundinis]
MEEDATSIPSPPRPALEQGLHGSEYESDSSSASSSRWSGSNDAPPPPRPKDNTNAKSMFVDATIAQDDTQGKTSEGFQLLADMGLELERRGIGLKSDANKEHMRGTIHFPVPKISPFSSRPHATTQFGHGGPSSGRLPGSFPGHPHNIPPGIPGPPHGIPGGPPLLLPPYFWGTMWNPVKVHLDSAWRQSVARNRSTAEAFKRHSGPMVDASVLSEDVLGMEGVSKDQPKSAKPQFLYSPGHTNHQNIESGNTETAATSGELHGASKENCVNTMKSGEIVDESVDRLSPVVEHGSPYPAGVEPSPDFGTPPEGAGISGALAEIADRYLKLDVLDHSQDVSQYIGYLLDTIHSLDSKYQYECAQNLIEKPKERVSDSDSELSAEEEKVPRSQVLHRVVCSVSWHAHRILMFTDEPKHSPEASEENKGLCGNSPVPDVGYYLQQHQEVVFIIVKDHECVQITQTRRNEHLLDEIKLSERRETMQITSAALHEALKRVAEYEPYSRNMEDRRGWVIGEMEAPYIFLFHHYQKLHDLVQDNDSYRPTLGPLLQFLEQNYAEEYRSAVELFQRGFVTAYHSTKLYKPFEVLVARKKDDRTLRARVLKRLPERMSVEQNKGWKLECWSWSYNGQEAKRHTTSEYIDAFEAEEVPINKLGIYPLKYAKPEDIEMLRESGRRFWSIRHQSLRCYTGWGKKHDRYYSNDRFVVDVATYHVMHGDRTISKGAPTIFIGAPTGSSTHDKWPQRIDAMDEIPQDCELLLPNAIQGFHLETKKWVVLYIDGFLTRVDWNKDAFKHLVLEERTKEMIRALVHVHRSRNKAMDDIIKGKGNGLILLLHGSPGTGKTLTAESVAEIAEKPLYRVTCGDIGTAADDVEKYLQTVMYLGKIWDCVLLLDEADVFLEERTMADLARNSLVSVFLRILEYHDGILILTSNRVGTFDEAFKSRIQVAIHYDNLTKNSRKAIWGNFFDMIEKSGEDANMSELEGRLEELAGEEMNGRQIRNALLTARQLAQYRKERLGWEHLNQVMKTSAAFNKYLRTIKGHTDDRWAREEGIR